MMKTFKKQNNLTKRLLSLTLSIVMIITMWGGYDGSIAYAETKPISEIENFGLNTTGTVKANWSQSEQKLRITGTGKIEIDKWKELAQKFDEDNAENNHMWQKNTYFTIEFVDDTIMFPDDTSIKINGGYTGFFTYFKGEIILRENMDVSNVTNMSWMFAYTQTANPDVSKWDVSNVKSMYAMFPHAQKANPDVSNWDVSNVVDMSHMFAYTQTANPDVSQWDVSNVITIISMFEGVQTANPDVSKWNAPKLKYIVNMFSGAKAVQKIDLSNIGATNIDAEYAFLDTPKLEKLKISGLKNVKLNIFADKYIIYNIDKDTKTNVDAPKSEQTLDNNTNYIIYLQSASPILKIHTVTFDTDGGSSISPVKLIDGNKVVKPKDPTKKGYTFAKWQSSGTDYDFNAPVTADITLKAVWTKKETTPETSFTTFDLNTTGTVKANWSQSEQKLRITGKGKIETDKWKELAQKFHKDNAGKNDMWKNNSDFIMEFVDATIMFPDDTSIKINGGYNTGFFTYFGGEIILKEKMDVSNVTDMRNMFYYSQTANPDVSQWDVSNVTNMKSMFSYTGKANPDVSNWDVSNVTDMRNMFGYAETANPDVSQWDVSNVTDMDYMFCYSQTANPDVSQWDVSNVKDMSYMFFYSQTANPDVSQWNAPKLKYIANMFNGAKAVQKIDLSNIGATSIDAEKAFLYTPKLEYLKISGLKNVKLNIFADKYIIENLDTGVKTNVDDPKSKQNLDDNTNYHIYLQAPTTHTVTFDTDGGSPIPNAIVPDNSPVTRPTDPAKSGYTFVEWQESGTKYDFTTPVTADITLKAVWAKDSSSSSSSGGGTSSSSSTRLKDDSDTDDNSRLKSILGVITNEEIQDEKVPKSSPYKIKATLKIGSKNYTLVKEGKEEEKQMDVAPFIENGRTMLPLRYIGEILGLEVQWDKNTRIAILTDEDTMIKIPIDSNKIFVNGKEYKSDTKPVIKSGRAFLSISNIAKALGLEEGKNIIWNKDTKQVEIKY